MKRCNCALNVFMLILDREPFDIMRGSAFIDKKCICVGQTPLYANHQILKLLKAKNKLHHYF